MWIAPESNVPVIGASGAIAGVLGAYFILYPRGRILTILPIFIFIQFIEIPAVIYLLFWFAVQLYAGLEEGGRAGAMGGVAWWAHIGGFMFGVALGPMLAMNRPRRRRSRSLIYSSNVDRVDNRWPAAGVIVVSVEAIGNNLRSWKFLSARWLRR